MPKESLINKPPSFFKEYSGGKRAFLKEEKITNEFKKGGRYYINKEKIAKKMSKDSGAGSYSPEYRNKHK